MRDRDTFRSAATELLGPRGFTYDKDLVEPWLTDWRGRYTGKAVGLASPASTDEVLFSSPRSPVLAFTGGSKTEHSVRAALKGDC